MNLQIITHVKMFTKTAVVLGVFLMSAVSSADWKVDLSRRAKVLKPVEKRLDYGKSYNSKKGKTVFNYFDGAKGPMQEIVIINTDNGFVPANLNLKKDQAYKIHVVNVNSKSKNTSFIMEDFSEHHGTYFGEKKSFVLHPKKEGVFRFVSPETAAQGQVVVSTELSLKRKPASE